MRDPKYNLPCFQGVKEERIWFEDYAFNLEKLFGQEDFEITECVDRRSGKVVETFVWPERGYYEKRTYYPLRKEPKPEYAELWERFWNEKDEVKRREIWEQLPKTPEAKYCPGAFMERYLRFCKSEPFEVTDNSLMSAGVGVNEV
jgi:hypothetical protein